MPLHPVPQAEEYLVNVDPREREIVSLLKELDTLYTEAEATLPSEVRRLHGGRRAEVLVGDIVGAAHGD